MTKDTKQRTLGRLTDSLDRIRSLSSESHRISSIGLISLRNQPPQAPKINNFEEQRSDIPTITKFLESQNQASHSSALCVNSLNNAFLSNLSQKIANYSTLIQPFAFGKDAEGFRETIRDHLAFKKCLQAEDLSTNPKSKISNKFTNKFKKHMLDSKNQCFSAQKMDDNLTYLSLESLSEFEQVRSLNYFMDNRSFCHRRFSKAYFKHVVIETSEREETSVLSKTSNQQICEYVRKSSFDSRQPLDLLKAADSPSKFVVTVGNSQAKKVLVDSWQETLSTQSHSKDFANEGQFGRNCRELISEYEFESDRKGIDFEEGLDLYPKEILSSNNTTPSKQFQSLNPHSQSSAEKKELSSASKTMSDKLIASLQQSVYLPAQSQSDSKEITTLLQHDLITGCFGKHLERKRAKTDGEAMLGLAENHRRLPVHTLRDNRFIPNFN